MVSRPTTSACGYAEHETGDKLCTWLPLVGVVLFLFVLLWRSWWQRRRYGSRGVLLFASGRWEESARDALGVALALLLVGQAVVAAVRPRSLAPITTMDPPATLIGNVTGALLLFGGIALLVAAQLNLGASWRIGIEEGVRPGLVTNGFYRFCRNPIFFAILVILAGYALLLPTRLSFLLLIGAFIGIRQQVLTEEAYLSRTYGDAYRTYARRVGRFVPGIGKLR
jgi:protein-S-isoprenylcysteine O-methyltransferase Ste14